MLDMMDFLMSTAGGTAVAMVSVAGALVFLVCALFPLVSWILFAFFTVMALIYGWKAYKHRDEDAVLAVSKEMFKKP